MKMKLISAVSTALLLGAGVVPLASAQGTGTADARNANAAVGVRPEVSVTSAGVPDRGNATSTAAQAARDNANSDGKLTAEAHRSAVATFVQSLLAVANREGGIGAQVRAVAQSQQDSASTSAKAIANVEDRGWLRTVLFGSDYRSLGQLRSEMVTTNANITQLKNLLGNAVLDADKAELSAQIAVLEDLQAKTEAFVQTRESSFSIFGWFTKRFAQ